VARGSGNAVSGGRKAAVLFRYSHIRAGPWDSIETKFPSPILTAYWTKCAAYTDMLISLPCRPRKPGVCVCVCVCVCVLSKKRCKTSLKLSVGWSSLREAKKMHQQKSQRCSWVLLGVSYHSSVLAIPHLSHRGWLACFRGARRHVLFTT
jgi:hypothetical protein